MKLLLVDDHSLFREGMELVLKHLEPQTEVVHAESVHAALARLAADPGIDLVLLDLNMPGMTGLDALLTLRARAETAPVVVLSGSEDTQTIWRAIDAGAMGFIQKQSDSHTTMKALRVVLDGGIYLPPVCLTESGRRGPSAPPVATPGERLAQLGISSRQAQALARMTQGKSNKIIARELGISETTVKSHLSAVFLALDVHSRTEAMYAIARLGLRLQDLGPVEP